MSFSKPNVDRARRRGQSTRSAEAGLLRNFAIDAVYDIDITSKRLAAAPWNEIVPFEINMWMAARRHLEAADELAKGVRRDVAGYLYGIAAECAFKAMMLQAGLKPLAKEKQRDDPFFKHFPELRTTMRDTLRGRRGTPLVTYVQNDAFHRRAGRSGASGRSPLPTSW